MCNAAVVRAASRPAAGPGGRANGGERCNAGRERCNATVVVASEQGCQAGGPPEVGGVTMAGGGAAP